MLASVFAKFQLGTAPWSDSSPSAEFPLTRHSDVGNQWDFWLPPLSSRFAAESTSTPNSLYTLSKEMSIFQPVPKPESPLARYRTLSPTAGIHVSPLQLGAMNIGNKWNDVGMGAMTKESSFQLLDAFYDAGGNFIDTANNYQDQSSEEFIGEWAEARGIRDQLVIATKYASPYMHRQDHVKIKTNYVGNNLKSMYLSVDASLRKLRTSYIDILYVHWWDFETSIEEVMNGLHILVQERKVIYLGISDTAAWIVARANQYARDHGKTPFVVYQGCWNVMSRDFERDIIPMARAEGMALAPWGVVGAGRFRTDEEEERRRQTGENGRSLRTNTWERNETEKAMSRALEQVAKEVGTKHITAVAIAYVMHKAPYVFPIVGGRKVEHLQANMESLKIRLTAEQIKFLESVVPFDPGFPHTFSGDGSEYIFMMKCTAWFEKQPFVQPILPAND